MLISDASIPDAILKMRPLNLRRIPFLKRRIDPLVRKYKLRGFRADMYDTEEAATWSRSGLDFARGIDRLNAVLQSLDRPKFDLARDSIHCILAACVGPASPAAAHP